MQYNVSINRLEESKKKAKFNYKNKNAQKQNLFGSYTNVTNKLRFVVLNDRTNVQRLLFLFQFYWKKFFLHKKIAIINLN